MMNICLAADIILGFTTVAKLVLAPDGLKLFSPTLVYQRHGCQSLHLGGDLCAGS
jgi:hypothetical protein